MDGQVVGKGNRIDYKEYDRELMEQFMHGLEDEGMISEILRELPVLEDINDVTSERYCYGPKEWKHRE